MLRAGLAALASILSPDSMSSYSPARNRVGRLARPLSRRLATKGYEISGLDAQKCSALFEHVYESYPEREGGMYAMAG